jgi:hypothetical protein
VPAANDDTLTLPGELVKVWLNIVDQLLLKTCTVSTGAVSPDKLIPPATGEAVIELQSGVPLGGGGGGGGVEDTVTSCDLLQIGDQPAV